MRRPGSGGSGSRAGRYQRRRATARRDEERCSSGTASARAHASRAGANAGEQTLAAQLTEPAAGRCGRLQAQQDLPPNQGLRIRPQSGYSSGTHMWAPRGAGVASKAANERPGREPGLSRSCGARGAGGPRHLWPTCGPRAPRTPPPRRREHFSKRPQKAQTPRGLARRSVESPLPDSNRRPLPYHGSALPAELRGRGPAG